MIYYSMGKASRKKTKAAGEAHAGERGLGSSHLPAAGSFLQKPLVPILLIAVLGLLVYSNTFHSPFQWDGKPEILENSLLKDLDNFISSTKGYEYNPRRFIGYLSFALNYHVGGFDVIGYHIFNLVIHIANALLVYFLLILTFRTPYFSNQRSAISDLKATGLASRQAGKPASKAIHDSRFTIHDSRLIALFSALLFVSHPLQTQAVTYIVQRFTSLATLFYLLSIVFYIKSRLASRQAGKLAGYLLSFVSAVLAMKTKEIAFTLPLVIVIYEFTFFKSSFRKKLLFLLPIVLTLIIVPLSVLHTGKPLGEILSDVSEKTKVQTQMSRWDYLMTEIRVIVTYIRLIFVPINQNLDYDYPKYHSLFTQSVFLSFLFLLSLFGLGIYLLYKTSQEKGTAPLDGSSLQGAYRLSSLAPCYRLIGFGIVWFFITLSVESSVIPIVDVIFEHRVYLPSFGLLTAIAAGALTAAKMLKIERTAIAILALATLVLSGSTYARNIVWKDETSLWEDVIKKSPNKARPNNNLGVFHRKHGRMNEAIKEYAAALRLDPDYPDAHNNLGNVYYAQGRMDDALKELQAALKLKPDYPDAHNNLGNVYYAQGRMDNAIREYQTAVKLKPDYAEAHYNLGNVYRLRGHMDEAIREYETALKLKPNYADAHNNLGIVYALQGRMNEAIKEYQATLRLDPDYADAHNNLGNVYRIQGRTDDALRELQAALRLKPDFAEAHNNLGIVYYAQGRMDEAVAEFQTALRLKSDYPEARNNMENISKMVRRKK